MVGECVLQLEIKLMSTIEQMPGMYTHRMHRVGGVLLAISGIISCIIGLATLFGMANLPSGASTLLTGGVMAGATLGAVFLVFGLIEIAGGYVGYRGRNWNLSILGSVLGLFTIVTLPLALSALVLFGLSENQFPSKEREAAESAASEEPHHPAD